MNFILKSESTGRLLAIIGIALQVVPLVSVAWTVIGEFSKFFAPLNRSSVGIITPVSQVFDHTLSVLLISLAISAVGCVLMVLSLTGCRYRAEWFFWLTVILAVLLLNAFPIGTGFGVFFLVYALTKHDEFLKRPKASSPELPPTLQ